MQAWQYWLLTGLILLLADIFLVGGSSGVLLVLAAATLGGMLGALFGLGFTGQLLLAAVLGLLAVPPAIWIMRRITAGKDEQSLQDMRIAGQIFPVVTQGSRMGIKVLGDFFPVRLSTGQEPSQGQQVEVIRFEGIIALVRPVDGD